MKFYSSFVRFFVYQKTRVAKMTFIRFFDIRGKKCFIFSSNVINSNGGCSRRKMFIKFDTSPWFLIGKFSLALP